MTYAFKLLKEHCQSHSLQCSRSLALEPITNRTEVLLYARSWTLQNLQVIMSSEILICDNVYIQREVTSVLRSRYEQCNDERLLLYHFEHSRASDILPPCYVHSVIWGRPVPGIVRRRTRPNGSSSGGPLSLVSQNLSTETHKSPPSRLTMV